MSVTPESLQNSEFEVLKPYGLHLKSPKRKFVRRLLAPILIGSSFLYGMAFALTAPFLLLQFTVPLLLLGAVVIWALPETKRAPDRTMELLFFAFFIALFLWPVYLAIALPGLPWITLIRLTGFPMAALFLICVSMSEEFRRRIATVLSASPLVWKLFVVFLVMQTVTIVMSSAIGASIQKYIAAQVNWTCVFFLCCYVFSKPGRSERWAILLWIIAVLVCLIGAYELTMELPPWANSIPSFLQIEDESVRRILSGAAREGQYRVQSTFTTPLGLAEFVALVLPFTLHFITGPYDFRLRTAAAVSVPFFLFTVWTTDSRLGLVGFFTSFLIYLLMWALIDWRRHKGNLIAPTIVFAYPVIVAAAFASTIFVGRIREKVWGSGQYAASNEGRAAQFAEGIPMVLRNPIGHGVGQGAETLGNTNPAGTLTIDTYYLLIGLEYGVIGFLAYYGMFVIATIRAGKLALALPEGDREVSLLVPLTVALTNFIIIKSIFSNEDNHPLAFMMLGMVFALASRAPKPTVAAGGV